MAKKKEEVVQTEVPEAVAQPKAEVVTQEVVIAEVDFNELLEIEKAIRQTEDQFNKLAGNVKRLEKDLEVYYNHEKNLNAQIDTKRRELVKRYKLDEQRQWRIDINTRKVVYQS